MYKACHILTIMFFAISNLPENTESLLTIRDEIYQMNVQSHKSITNLQRHMSKHETRSKYKLQFWQNKIEITYD